MVQSRVNFQRPTFRDWPRGYASSERNIIVFLPSLVIVLSPSPRRSSAAKHLNAMTPSQVPLNHGNPSFHWSNVSLKSKRRNQPAIRRSIFIFPTVALALLELRLLSSLPCNSFAHGLIFPSSIATSEVGRHQISLRIARPRSSPLKRSSESSAELPADVKESSSSQSSSNADGDKHEDVVENVDRAPCFDGVCDSTPVGATNAALNGSLSNISKVVGMSSIGGDTRKGDLTTKDTRDIAEIGENKKITRNNHTTLW